MRHACAIAIVAASAASADTYDFVLVKAQSGAASTILVNAPVEGTFIGNYDPVTNPTGTQTRPGAFGGSGNNPIGYTADVSFGGDNDTPAEGVFRLTFDAEVNAISISFVDLDLLAGAQADLPLTIAIKYNSFNTINPTAIFFGGFTIPLPLGNATLASLTATSSPGPSEGTMVPTGPGTFDFAILATLAFEGSADFLGTPIEIPPTALPVPLVGTLDVSGPVAKVSIAIAIEQAQSIPGPIGEGFEGLPVPLPTILPPGGTANLLFSGEIQSIDFDLALDIQLIADGAAVCPPDCEEDGDLDIFDYMCYLDRFVEGDLYADFEGDGDLDVFDYMAFQNSFISGCAF